MRAPTTQASRMGPGPMLWAMNPAERKTPEPIMLAATRPTPEASRSLGAGDCDGTAAWYMRPMHAAFFRPALVAIALPALALAEVPASPAAAPAPAAAEAPADFVAEA